MALTTAERQARFRSRRKVQGHFKQEGTAMERLDVWVSANAAHGLRVLATLHGTTGQEELDALLLAAISTEKQRDRAAWSEASLGVLGSRATR